MQSNFSQIVKEALEASPDEFIRLVEEATRLICSEEGKIESLKITGRLVELSPKGEALVIGDLHGDIESLIGIHTKSNFLQRLSQNSNAILIFLGDYGDRGEYSKEIYYTVLKLKLLFPTQVVLMRGNHEGPEDLMASPHDLPYEFQAKFHEKWEKAYTKVRELFNCLYNAVLVEERFLIVHGGVPCGTKSKEDLAYAHTTHPRQKFLEELLWSDPDDTVRETLASPRGAGKLFGEKLTAEILKRLNVKIIIRGHEPAAEGFKINHNGKILTLFSRKGAPYFNAFGAYLEVRLSEKFENASQLVPFIYKF